MNLSLVRKGLFHVEVNFKTFSDKNSVWHSSFCKVRYEHGHSFVLQRKPHDNVRNLLKTFKMKERKSNADTQIFNASLVKNYSLYEQK